MWVTHQDEPVAQQHYTTTTGAGGDLGSNPSHMYENKPASDVHAPNANNAEFQVCQPPPPPPPPQVVMSLIVT